MTIENQEVSQQESNLEVLADSYVQIGSRHLKEGEPCQDYALARSETLTDPAIAVIADGCSASPRSELGAGFNCIFWEWFCKTYRFNRPISDMQALLAECYVERVSESLLYSSDISEEGSLFDATMLGLVYDRRLDRCVATICGDGQIISIYRSPNGELTWESDSVVWFTGMPAYPSYLLDKQRLNKYSRIRLSGELSQGILLSKGSSPEYSEESPLQVSDALGQDYGGRKALGLWVEIPRVRDTGEVLISVSVCSDGGTDIRDRDGQNPYPSTLQDHEEWVESLLKFPNPVGKFQFRQARKMLNSLLRNRGLSPFDDFSVATLVFKEELCDNFEPDQA